MFLFGIKGTLYLFSCFYNVLENLTIRKQVVYVLISSADILAKLFYCFYSKFLDKPFSLAVLKDRASVSLAL